MNLTTEYLEGFDSALAGIRECRYYTHSPAWAAWWLGHARAERAGWTRDGFTSVSQSRGYTLRTVSKAGETQIVPWPIAAEVRSYQERMGVRVRLSA